MFTYAYTCIGVIDTKCHLKRRARVPGAGEKILSNLNCDRFRESAQSFDRYLTSDTRFLNSETKLSVAERPFIIINLGESSSKSVGQTHVSQWKQLTRSREKAGKGSTWSISCDDDDDDSQRIAFFSTVERTRFSRATFPKGELAECFFNVTTGLLAVTQFILVE